MVTKRLLVLPAALLATGALAVAPALAKDGDVRVTGNCSGSADAKLKLSEEDGGLEIEFEVDENRSGRAWDVVLRQDGKRVLKRRATTGGASGSFEVRKVTGKPSGTVRARAISRATGETCTARASI